MAFEAACSDSTTRRLRCTRGDHQADDTCSAAPSARRARSLVEADPRRSRQDERELDCGSSGRPSRELDAASGCGLRHFAVSRLPAGFLDGAVSGGRSSLGDELSIAAIAASGTRLRFGTRPARYCRAGTASNRSSQSSIRVRPAASRAASCRRRPLRSVVVRLMAEDETARSAVSGVTKSVVDLGAWTQIRVTPIPVGRTSRVDSLRRAGDHARRAL